MLLGNGDGTFRAAVNYGTGTGSEPISVAVGDFNEDGRADIGVANQLSNSVSVLLNLPPARDLSITMTHSRELRSGTKRSHVHDHRVKHRGSSYIRNRHRHRCVAARPFRHQYRRCGLDLRARHAHVHARRRTGGICELSGNRSSGDSSSRRLRGRDEYRFGFWRRGDQYGQ